MKKEIFTILCGIGLSIGFTHAIAGSNNGYTTAANVYSGSSSLGWYGGGVAYRLAEWRKKEDVPEEPDNTVSANPDDPSTPVAPSQTEATTQDVSAAVAVTQGDQIKPETAADSPVSQEDTTQKQPIETTTTNSQ